MEDAVHLFIRMHRLAMVKHFVQISRRILAYCVGLTQERSTPRLRMMNKPKFDLLIFPVSRHSRSSCEYSER